MSDQKNVQVQANENDDDEHDGGKLDKPMSPPDLEVVIHAIHTGEYDNRFSVIEGAMDSRRKARRDAVIAQVREVFGEGASVSLPESESNPFIKRAAYPPSKAEKSSQQEVEILKEDELTPDSLEISEMNNVEKQMVSEVPIEQRGAIISGMTSSQMG